MKSLSHKRRVFGVLCSLLLAFLLFVPNTVEAASVTIGKGQRQTYSVAAAGGSVTVVLTGCSNSVLRGKPSWVSVSGRSISISKNTSTSSRSGDVVFQDGNSGPTYTLRISQSGAAPQTVSVRFNVNGGYGSIGNRTYTVGRTYGSLPAGPTPPTGKSFDGWYTAASGGSKITTSSTVSSSTTILYAHYSAKSYTVSFNSNGGSSVSSKTVTYGSSYGYLSSPTRSNYSFDGWYTASSGGSKVTSSTTVTTASNHTLYAHWTRNSVTVRFNVNGGSGSISNRSYYVGDRYSSLPAGPTPPAGYTFDGWYTAASGGTKITTSSTVSASYTTLYAHYSGKSITVSFNSNGGTSVSSKSVTVGGTYGSLSTPTRTGYNFQGWFTASSGGSQVTSSTKVSSTSNHTLYAHWSAKTFTVSFNSQGGSSVSSKTVTYGSTYGTLATPTRNGYNFDGWYTASTGGSKVTSSTKVTLTSNQTLYAHWSGKSITVKFDNNGGYGNVPSKTYTVGGSYSPLPAGSTPPAGHSFAGWYTAKSGGSLVTTSTTVSPSITTLYAHYTAKTFTVSFNSQGGSSVSAKTVTYGSTYGTLTTPTRNGYTFQGWFTAASGGSKITATTTVTITANQTLYAQWKANTITVKFNNNGGAGNVPSQSYVVGQKYGSLPAGSTPPAGYSFEGWYTAASGGVKITTSSTVSPSYTTLYAHYTPKTYTVSFNSQGGSSASNKTVTYNSTYGTLPTPTKTGYAFAGWYTAASGGSKVTDSTKVTTAANHTLYAHWTARTYTISFNSQGGSSVSSKSVTYGGTYGTLANPTKTGYTFQGWFTAASGGTKITASTKVTITANQTLYAQWKGAAITVKFDNNGGYGNVPSQTYVVDNTYGSLPAGTTGPTGYAFAGWYTAKSGGTKITTSTKVSPAYMTLYAHYSPKTFAVSFNSQSGSSVADKNVTYNGTYGSLPTPTRTGYNFAGWYTKAGGGTQVTSTTKVTTAANHTLYAHWTAKTFTITFNSQGGSSVASKTVTYNSSYGTLTNPTKDGYTFQGWFTAASGGTKVIASTKVKITANQTLYAQWKGAPITVKFDNNGGYGNVPSQTYVVDNAYGSLPAGTTGPTGYAFAGWYTAKSGGTKITTTTKVSPAYKTLYAHYSPKTFTVTFNSQLGSSVPNKTVTYNGTYGTLTAPTRTGYTFAGWFTKAGGGTQVTSSTKVTTAANHTLYAHWTAKTFTITFNSQGGSSVSSKSVTYNSSYGTLANPTKNGYIFQGWFTAASGGTKVTASTKVTITANQTLYAQWKGAPVTVKFDNNGGYGNVPSQTYTVGEKYGSLPTGSTPPAGHAFAGWFTAKSGGTKITVNSTVSPSYTVLYAHYTAKTYTVTFNSQGGSSVGNLSVTYGNAYGTLPVPTKNGYTFQGWYTAATGGTKITAASKVTTAANHTLYAQWKSNVITVKFDSNGGYGNVPSKSFTVGEKYGSLPAGSTPPTGYAFAGWYTAKSGGTKITANTIVSPSYTTLYAHYTAKTYTVKFNSNGGSAVSSKTVTYASTYGTLPTPTKSGYKLDGWYTAATGGSKVTASTKVTTAADHTLYARWTYNSVTVKFDVNGGSGNIPNRSYEIGKAYGTLPVGPTAPAYKKFNGWYTAKTGGTKITTSTVAAASVTTLYAQYTGDTAAFFTANPRYKTATSAKTIPYNSSIASAKNVTMDQYMAIYRSRSGEYNTKGLSDEDYIKDIRSRAKVLDVGASVASVTLTPEAGKLLKNYFHGDGSRLDYDGSNYVFDLTSGTAAYNKVANDLMDQMEKYLGAGQKITFVDKDSASNHISFYPDGFDINGLNNFFAVKEGSTGVSGSCTFDGSVYRMDLYFYVQDYYDFYYEDGDLNSQADYHLFTVYIDELAYLVPFGYAKPYESCGIFHTKIAWYAGQEANIISPFWALNPENTLAEISQLDY